MENNIVPKYNINYKFLDGINCILAGLILRYYFISLLLIPYGLYIIIEILYNKYNNDNNNYYYYIKICKIIEEPKEKEKNKIELYIEKIINVKYKEKLTFTTLNKLPNTLLIDYSDPLIRINNKINLIYLIIRSLVINNKYNDLLNICIYIIEAYELLNKYDEFSYDEKIEYFNSKLNEFIINYNILFNTNYNNSFETINNIYQELLIKLNYNNENDT